MWTFSRILTWFDLCGPLAEFWLDLTYLDLSWPLLTYLDLSWLILTYLDLYCTYIDLSWNIFTNLDLSWPKLTYLDLQESFAAYAGSCLFLLNPSLSSTILENIVTAWRKKSQHSCNMWAHQPNLTPPCSDFACVGLRRKKEEIHNLKNWGIGSSGQWDNKSIGEQETGTPAKDIRIPGQ